MAFGALGFNVGPIAAIAWRRSNSNAAFSALVQNVVCRIGFSDLDPTFLPGVFSAVPKGTPTTVHNGPLNLPAAPPPVPPPAPFSLVLTFSAPWVFVSAPSNGRSLMIDVEASSTPATAWHRDARLVSGDGRAATSASLGAGCNGSNALAPTTALVTPISAMPGGTIALSATNLPAAAVHAFTFLGFQSTAPFPIDLAFAGAPGCLVRTDLFLTQMLFTREPGPNFTRAYGTWPVPADPSLAGASVNFQWAAIDPQANALGLVVSSALRVSLGTPPTRSFATQSQWTFTQGTDLATQTAGEFGGIVQISGALQ